MSRTVRTYLALTLALILTVTSQGMAVARGAMVPAGQMVLCTGTGQATVFVDEDGQPVEPPHHCPDCVLHLAEALLPPDTVPADVPRALRPSPVRSLSLAAPKAVRRATARAPPA